MNQVEAVSLSDMADPLRRFAETSTSIISDNLDRLSGAIGLEPYHRIEHVMVGRALTVKVAPGDNLFIHRALEELSPGTVLVIDGGGDVSRALIGEIISLIAETRGAAGIVVDGAVRDTGVIGSSPFPVYARAANHLGPYKNGPGKIGVDITIGGMVVHPGDVVVGDRDGVVAFPHEAAERLLTACLKTERAEAEIIAQIRSGTYTGAYARTV